VELNENRERLRKKGLGIAAISYDSVEVLKNFTERKQVSIPLLSDPDSAVIRAFGLLNESIPQTSSFFGVPNPVTYIVGPDGVIESAYREDDYRKRFTAGAILSDAAPGSETEAGGNTRIVVSAASSDTVVRGGERIRLFLTVRLAKKVHVYAPGVEGYKAVEWHMEATPAVPESMAPIFPKSRLLRLKPIKETVPVFENEFRIYRDVVVGQPRDVEKMLDASRHLTIEGKFRYQACDDKKCWLPDEIPVKWTLRYEAHDSSRVPAELQRKK